MATGTFSQDGRTIDYTPGAATAAGDIVLLGTRIGVAPSAIDANKLGSLQVEGVFEMPKATGESWTLGASL